jgi:hypothetical protein
VAADGVDQGCRGGDVAAHAAERLAERALDDGDPVHHAVALGDAAAVLAVHADGVDLVEVGHGAVALGQVADLGHGAEVAVHRVDALERDQLRPRRVAVAEQALEVGEVVVAKTCFSAP